MNSSQYLNHTRWGERGPPPLVARPATTPAQASRDYYSGLSKAQRGYEYDENDRPSTVGMGVGRRFTAPTKDVYFTPGPGAYNARFESSKYEAPYYTIAPKLENEAWRKQPGTKTPGPGTYDGDPMRATAPSYSMIARRATALPECIAVPSPAHYDASPVIGSTAAPSYTMRPRTEKAVTTTPGPGEYALPATLGGESKSFSQRFPERSVFAQVASSALGPGAYSPEIADRNSYHYSMSARLDGVNAPRDRPPGVGTYQIDVEDMSKRATKRGYSIQAPNTRDLYPKTPGPGAYSPAAVVDKGTPGFSLGASMPTNELVIEDYPGPGTYDLGAPVPKRGAAPAYSITARRPDIPSRLDRTPGPGSYQERPALTYDRGWSMQPKGADTTMSKVPGPGAYNPAPHIDTLAHGRSFDKARLERQVPVGGAIPPGPGHYQVVLPTFTPSYTLGQMPPHTRDAGTPGPGYYDMNEHAISNYRSRLPHKAAIRP